MPAQGASNAGQPGMPLLCHDWEGARSRADADYLVAPVQPGLALEMPSWQADAPASRASVTGRATEGCGWWIAYRFEGACALMFPLGTA